MIHMLNQCFVCNKTLIKSQKKFCSSSCSAIHNNTIRSQESRTKQKQTIIKTIKSMSEEEYNVKYCTNVKRENSLFSAGYNLITDEDLIVFVSQFSKFSELFEYLGLKDCRPNRDRFIRRFKKLNINYENLLEKKKCKTITKNCLNCDLLFSKRGKCCSRSCAAQLRHFECRGSTSGLISKKGTYKNNKNCLVCNKPSFTRKTCSPKCLSITRSLNSVKSLRKRRLSGEDFSFRRKSKLESKFETFLLKNNVKFLSEVYAKSPYNSSGYYRLDFVLKSKKLIIEIDGKHHENTKQMHHDILRDYAMIERGWKVLRINYYEVNKPVILEMIYKQHII